jgi:hypothetical protein
MVIHNGVMNEYPRHPEAAGPYDAITAHIISLAKLAKPDEFGFCAARFRPANPQGIAWILLRVTQEQRQGCTAIIQYEDETVYDIDWRDGDIWTLQHRDPAQAEGGKLDRALPFANGVKRIDYLSDRFSEDLSFLNLRDRTAPSLVNPAATQKMVDAILDDLVSSEETYASAYSKEVDPKDINLTELLAPVVSLQPSDRVYIYPPDFKR